MTEVHDVNSRDTDLLKVMFEVGPIDLLGATSALNESYIRDSVQLRLDAEWVGYLLVSLANRKLVSKDDGPDGLWRITREGEAMIAPLIQSQAVGPEPPRPEAPMS